MKTSNTPEFSIPSNAQMKKLKSYWDDGNMLNATLERTELLTKQISEHLKKPLKLKIEVERTNTDPLDMGALFKNMQTQLGTFYAENQQSLNNYKHSLNDLQIQVQKMNQDIIAVPTIIQSTTPTSSSSETPSSANIVADIQDSFDNFTSLFAVDSIASMVTDQFKESVGELMGLETVIQNIAQTAELSNSKVTSLRDTMFDTANKYGKSASSYLDEVQAMANAGYKDPAKMGELSLQTQTAGNISSDIANEYLMASDAARGYQGNIALLNTFLDAQYQLASRNSISMEELTTATSTAISSLSNAGLMENEISALLGTGISSTNQSGVEVGETIQDIVATIQQASGKLSIDEPIIDIKQLITTKEKFHNLGIELTSMKDGITSLRSSIEILRELATVYNALPNNSSQKESILNDISGPNNRNVLDNVLTNFDQYDTMKADFGNSAGASLSGIDSVATDWESSMNRISNSWNELVQNFVSSDFILGGANLFNGLLQGLDGLIEKFGVLSTMGVALGAGAFIKNLD